MDWIASGDGQMHSYTFTYHSECGFDMLFSIDLVVVVATGVRERRRIQRDKKYGKANHQKKKKGKMTRVGVLVDAFLKLLTLTLTLTSRIVCSIVSQHREKENEKEDPGTLAASTRRCTASDCDSDGTCRKWIAY